MVDLSRLARFVDAQISGQVLAEIQAKGLPVPVELHAGIFFGTQFLLARHVGGRIDISLMRKAKLPKQKHVRRFFAMLGAEPDARQPPMLVNEGRALFFLLDRGRLDA